MKHKDNKKNDIIKTEKPEVSKIRSLAYLLISASLSSFQLWHTFC
jgi:hypothetical protein